MTQDIIDMARQAGFSGSVAKMWAIYFEAFAKLVAAKEREAMLEVLKQMVEALETAWTYDEDNADGYYFEAIQAGKQAIAELESQEPVDRDWREAPWGFGEKRLSTVEYSDIVSDGGLDPRNKFDASPQRTEPVALPCCGYTDASAVKWNPLNGVVQCHNCGQAYTTPHAQPAQRTEPVSDDIAYIPACRDMLDAQPIPNLKGETK